jgi:aspartyl/asparaginyl beta-hydroxylase (cupin superfamily)
LVDRLGRETHLGSAAFYLLGPRSHVRPHRGRGAVSGFLRCHLGLLCPPSCELRVGHERRRWTTGGVLVFDDALEHEAWNPSAATRCVLHLDFADPGRPASDIPALLGALRDEAFADLLRTRPIVLAADLVGPADFTSELLARRETTKRDTTTHAALEAGAEQLARHGLFL